MSTRNTQKPPETLTLLSSSVKPPTCDVRLRICLKPAHVSPGTYTGTITIAAAGINRASLGVQVSRRQAPSSAILWIALGGLLGLISGYVYGGLQLKRPANAADHLKYW